VLIVPPVRRIIGRFILAGDLKSDVGSEAKKKNEYPVIGHLLSGKKGRG